MTQNCTFDGNSVIFIQRRPNEMLDEPFHQEEKKINVVDPSTILEAELRMLDGEIPPNGHIGVNLHQYLTSYQEAFEEDKCCSSCCAMKSFRRLKKAERLVNNIKHAAACVIQQKLFWPWRTRSPMLRQPNDGFEFIDWSKEELEEEVEWYRQKADQYSINLLVMHGYKSECHMVYQDVKDMTRDELIQEIEELQSLLNDCDEYLEQTQKEYEEDMYWRDFEWRKVERDRILGILDKEKRIEEANKCYIGGWDQLQKDQSRVEEHGGDDNISDDQWNDWWYTDRRGLDVREEEPDLSGGELW